MSAKRGRVVVIGAGPAGNILNLWPPPIKALGLLGVDVNDLGAPCYSEFRSAAGRARVRVNLPDEVVSAYGGGFIGLLRHHAPAPLRPVRDAILDRTPFLQKVVGESSPGEILAQISAIDEAEQRFTAVSTSLAARASPLLSLNENRLAGVRSLNA